jgi:hypothetical protein
MRYIVKPLNHAPFFSERFSIENNYEAGMIVYDLYFNYYLDDGLKWKKIKSDHF